MKRLMLKYAEDFRENRIAPAVYAQLRDHGFDPLTVDCNYDVERGNFYVDFFFDDGGANLSLEDVLTRFEIPSSVKISLINVNSGVVG